jgi:hypothetical protein
MCVSYVNKNKAMNACMHTRLLDGTVDEKTIVPVESWDTYLPIDLSVTCMKLALARQSLHKILK